MTETGTPAAGGSRPPAALWLRRRGYTVAVVCLLFALFMAVTMASNLFIQDIAEPHSRFIRLLISVTITGVLTGALLERFDLHIFVN